MISILVLDPGIRNPAIALFHDDVLVVATRVALPRAWSRLDIGERCRLVSAEIWRASATHVGLHVDLVIYEWPKVYTPGKSKGDPGDLLPLACVGGGVAALAGAIVVTYEPSEWTGGLPKSETGPAWSSPRGIRVWSRLSETERAACEATHDAIDACGIGLHHLGRLARRRNFPGST